MTGSRRLRRVRANRRSGRSRFGIATFTAPNGHYERRISRLARRSGLAWSSRAVIMRPWCGAWRAGWFPRGQLAAGSLAPRLPHRCAHV